jgi:hypothetical protein
MTGDPLVFNELPMPIKILVIAGAIFLCPYLLIQAWREGRRCQKQH